MRGSQGSQLIKQSPSKWSTTQPQYGRPVSSTSFRERGTLRWLRFRQGLGTFSTRFNNPQTYQQLTSQSALTIFNSLSGPARARIRYFWATQKTQSYPVMLSFRRLNTLAGWLTFAVALATYSATVERTASFWDCGEFIACSFKLQVPTRPAHRFSCFWVGCSHFSPSATLPK